MVSLNHDNDNEWNTKWQVIFSGTIDIIYPNVIIEKIKIHKSSIGLLLIFLLLIYISVIILAGV